MSVLAAIFTVLVGAFVFGAAALLGVMAALALLPKLTPPEDGPAPLRVHPAALIGGAALLGAFMAWRHAPMPELLTSALLVRRSRGDLVLRREERDHPRRLYADSARARDS